MKGFDLSKLRINPNNPYPFSGSDTEWADFKKKLDRDPEFMEANKIAFDSSRDNLIIAGNKRVQALRELGWKMIPDKYVIDCKDWSEEKRERYIYASNWNIGQWSMEFTSEEQAEEWGITFEEEEEVHLEAQEDDYVPPAEIQTDIVRGDLFELKKGDLCHRILCGDSTSVDDVEKLMGGNKPFLMITDPPYGVEYNPKWRDEAERANGKSIGERALGQVQNDNNADWTDTWAISPSKIAYVYHADKFSNIVRQSLENCDYEISNQIIWAKNNFAISRGNYHYKHEPCWYAYKKGSTRKWIGGHSQTTVWEIDKPLKSETGHGTQKPIECMARPISNHKGDVYDPFLGSGTTLIAAHQLERNCYGIEIDEKYCQVGIDRMLKLDEEIQLFRNGKDVTEKYRKRLLADEKQT